MTREEAIKTLKGEAWICCSEKWNEALDMAIKALEQEPVIEPLERLAESAVKTAKVLERLSEQERILDKIRAEIEEIIGESNLADHDFCSGLICARKIIDKYRKEN